MKHLECLLLSSTPASQKRARSLERAAVKCNARALHQSVPTHLLSVRWHDGEYNPRWLVLLRADNSGELVETDGSGNTGFSCATTEKVLQLLGIQVAIESVGIGGRYNDEHFSLDGIFPGDEEFAELLADSRFVRYLKARVEEESQWDVRPARPITLD